MKPIIIALIALLFLACQQDEFEAKIQYLGTDAIKYVRLYPNSSVLMADGKAQLKFKVKAFTEIERTKTVDNQQVTYLDTMELIYDRLPLNQISISTADGQKIENYTYTTNQVGNGAQRFVAKIGNISSEPVEVKVIAKPAAFPRVTIPVVFHILPTVKTKNACDGVTNEFVDKLIARLNQVFAGEMYAAPSAIDSGIRFELADKDPQGKLLETPGIRREDRKSETTAELTKYVKENLMWDPVRYLNIWIYDSSPYSDPSKAPAYVLNNGTEIPGLDLDVVEKAEDAAYSTPAAIGITIAASKVFSTNLENTIGIFFGLLPTAYKDWEENLVDGDTDYCPDTYAYESMYFAAEKWTYTEKKWDRIYYDSYNIMDDASAATTISYDQAVRIHKVIENCPLRMMRK